MQFQDPLESSGRFRNFRAACVFGLLIAINSGAPAAESSPASSLETGQTAATSELGPNELDPIVVTGRRLTESLWDTNTELDKARDKALLPTLGATDYSIDQDALLALPQGRNTPLDKVVLQIPGVSYDSAISNPDFHVRNEYANVQYRINGIQLPDGVSALSSVLEPGFVGNLNLLDGALPAQYGLRTAAVVDITTKTEFDAGGNLDLYGGSWGTVSPSIEYGNAWADTQYFLTGRYLLSDQGLENATPMENPIHDRTTQEKFFGYGSTLFGDSSRLTYMSGAFVGHFQIPDVEGQAPLGDFGSSALSSASLDENETDRFFFAVAALQTHRASFDTQFSVFTRYATVDFVPDLYGDLVFNDVASNVVRKSLLNGLQFDAADRVSETHTLRAGSTLSLEKTQVEDLSTVLPLNAEGSPVPTPVMVNDYTSKIGWTAGAYVQDEWRLRPDLTLNTGVRFDQMNQFVSANQLSPRIALIYDPLPGTTLHAGVSRYFTPPMQAQATQANLVLFRNTVQQSAIAMDDPVRPERSTYFDAGVDRTLLPGLALGVDVYYKRSTDTLDDGQFGQAVVLNEYNYARGFSRGAEFKLSYARDGFRGYANVSHEITKVKNVVSNQYLIGDPVELAYLASTYTYASDAQTVTASGGAAYRWHRLLASLDGFYGSGLRAGFANEEHTPAYTQWNAAVSWDCNPWGNQEPLTLRLSAINLFDRSYLLRGDTGIGEFAPQYGPRRGLFVEFNQRF
jgi:outer membrane receptor protein involved in Fe transport